jgi:hypothetical protein
VNLIENTWIFPALEALHVVGLALLVGTIVLDDLRTLGVTKAFARPQLMRIGLWIMVLTGIPMFFSGYDRYRENPAFIVKMIALVVALGVHQTWHRRATRASAIASLALWTFVVFAARAVIDFDV